MEDGVDDFNSHTNQSMTEREVTRRWIHIDVMQEEQV